MVAVAKKETSARFLGQPGLSGGQPGRASPVFSACLACSQKISAAPVGKAFQRKPLETVSGLCALKQFIFPKPILGFLVKIQWVCVKWDDHIS